MAKGYWIARVDVRDPTACERNVVLEFPSCQAVLECYHSPEYARAKTLRQNASNGDLVIIEGDDGPQPDA